MLSANTYQYCNFEIYFCVLLYIVRSFNQNINHVIQTSLVAFNVFIQIFEI